MDEHPVGAVVCVHAKDMKDAWCLATSNADATAPQIINQYSRRWTIEPAGLCNANEIVIGFGGCGSILAIPPRDLV